jgi:hypothetical protein
MYPRLVKDAIRRSRMRDVSSPRSVSRARPGRRRAGCPEVGEVRGAAAIGARRDEADALHADVTPGREAVLRDNPCPAAAVEGEDPATVLVRGDELAGKAPERPRSDRNPVLDPRPGLENDARGAP